MLLDPQVLHSNKFTVSTEHKLISADASELGFRPGELPMGQLYDDAADEGITLISDRTNMRSHWFFEDRERTDKWEFRPTIETLRKFPQLNGWRVVIFND